MEIISYLISDNGEIYGKTSGGNIVKFVTIDKLAEIAAFTYEKSVKDNTDDNKQMFWYICKLAGMLVAKGVITKEEMDELMKIEVPGKEDI